MLYFIVILQCTWMLRSIVKIINVVGVLRSTVFRFTPEFGNWPEKINPRPNSGIWPEFPKILGEIPEFFFCEILAGPS